MDFGTPVAGRYRLDRHIASGGMGEVWRGFDEVLERPVAVKMLHRGPDEALRTGDRFAREAKILASLRGPGLVEVYDYGEVGTTPMRYIVMELVEGRPLTAVLAEHGRLSPRRTLRYVAATAEALDIAHRSGVVHRDIKPGNLLVESGGGLRVVDFGISLIDSEARLTSPKGILGTLSYVSPEQLSGREVRGAADFYSLGAVAYECLTGAPPFTSDDPRGVIHRHLYEDPPPLPGDVPPAVSDIVMRCMRKNPTERFGSGAELAAACRAVAETGDLGGPAEATGPVQVGPSSEADDGRRRRFLVALIAALLAFTVVGAVSIWRPWAPAQADSEPGEGGLAAATETANADQRSAATTPSPSTTTTAAADDEPTGEAATERPRPAPPSPSGDASSSPEPATDGDLPDVVGMDAAEARDRLNALGWTDVRIRSTLLPGSGASTEGCSIVSQHPDGGETVGFDEAVRINYYGLRDCP
ncbi:hypothetical protein GCM10027447_17140 [Glycomyces halotolerans]